MNKLVFALCLLVCVGLASVGSQLLADTVVLRPTAAVEAGAVWNYSTSYGYFSQTIDNGGLSSPVESGAVPAAWPTGSDFGTANGTATDGLFRDYSGQFTGYNIVYTVPTSLNGYTLPTITGIELWQHYEVYGSNTGDNFNTRDIASAMVSYSVDGGVNWSTAHQVNFDEAADAWPAAGAVAPQYVPLTGVPSTGVTNIMFTDLHNWGDPVYLGFNEIRFVGNASAVPEPSALLLLVTGLIGLLAYAWRRRR